MKIAYLILAHKNPEQLKRLVNRLNNQDASFFIHIDGNSDVEIFKAVFNSSGYKIRFVKRTRTSWGSFGLVQATLNGMQEALEYSEFDYLILLSGQCYPLKSNDSLKEFFSSNSGHSFIDSFEMPGPQWKGIYGMDRIERYHFHFTRKRTFPPYEMPSSIPAKILNVLFSIRFKMPRVFPNGMIPYGGTQWFNLHKDALKYILNFIKENPYYLEFHKYTFIPDEFFFHSILLNAPISIKSKIINDSLRCIDWNRKNVPLPVVFKKGDFSAIKNSSKIFARKFDSNIDSEILDMLDQYLDKRK